MSRATAWQEHAACAGANLTHFYPDTGHGARTQLHVDAVIRTYCQPCPVRAQCLAFELDLQRTDRWGVHGGVWWTSSGKVHDPLGVLPPGSEP